MKYYTMIMISKITFFSLEISVFEQVDDELHA
jgi:hypothetical protein